jgi:hypothetical protein
MTMHLMGPQFTTTNTRKPKFKNKTKSQIQAEKDHDKFLKRMGVHPDQREQRARSLTVKHPPYTRLNVSRLESDPGSNPGGSTNSRSVGKSGNPPHLGCGDQRFESSRSDQVFYDPSMAKKEEKVYTGTEIMGIAQMHKSNAVPIRNKKSAEEVAKMRRG